MLNSKTCKGDIRKRALSSATISSAELFYADLQRYLLSLKLQDGTPLYDSRRKTFVVGLICTLRSAIAMYIDLQASHSFLPTFRLSQDPIETLFSKVRRMGGHNNNPTVVEFQASIRRLVLKQNINASTSANCVDSFDTSGVLSIEWNRNKTSSPPEVDVSEFEIDNLTTVDLISQNTLYYIGGYIIRTLKVRCSSCALAVLDVLPAACISDHSYSYSSRIVDALVNAKNRGGLMKPSSPVLTILDRIEGLIRRVGPSVVLKQRDPHTWLSCLLARSLFEDQPVVIFTHDCVTERFELPHRHQLAMLIGQKYITIRLKYLAKQHNAVSDRTRLSRLIIFKNM